MIYLELFFSFLEVGCFAFGGYGAIPLIRDIVLARGWLGEEMVTTIIAVSESTPGPIMVNLATYVGSTQAGIPGAVIATAAVVLPSFLITILIAAVLRSAMKNPCVKAVIGGLSPCMVGIIFATGIYLIMKGCLLSGREFGPDPKAVLLTVLAAAVFFGSRKLLKRGITPIQLILLSAFLGIVFYK